MGEGRTGRLRGVVRQLGFGGFGEGKRREEEAGKKWGIDGCGLRARGRAARAGNWPIGCSKNNAGGERVKKKIFFFWWRKGKRKSYFFFQKKSDAGRER